MKNKEKYKDKILDIALQHEVVGVNKTDNSVESCDEIPSCNYCLFQSDDVLDSCDDEKFIRWLEEEEEVKEEDELPFDKLEYDSNICRYRWLYELEDEEDGFLRMVEHGYITRSMLHKHPIFYTDEPRWERGRSLEKGYWFRSDNCISLKDGSFDFIKAGECWAYNVNTQIDGNNEKIYNITKDLREDYV